MGKRGISAIVATVLVILITVAAVSIIWVGILPMVSDSLEFSALDGRVSVVSGGGYTLYDASREVAMVQVKREVDEGVMDRIVVSFLVDGNSVSSNVVAPASGGVKTYSFDLSSVGVPSSVEVAPIFASGSKEKVGGVTSSVDISSGTIAEVGDVYEMGRDYFYEESCLGVLNAGHSVGDGVYWINPDGEFKDLFSVYCDMTTDGGGWTLIARTGNDVCGGEFGWNYDIGTLGNLSSCYSLGVGNTDVSFGEIMWGINSNDFEWGDHVYKTSFSDQDVVTYSSSAGLCVAPIPIEGGNTANIMQRCKGHTDRDDMFFMRDGPAFSGYGMYGTTFSSVYCGTGDARGGYMCGEKAMLFVR